MLGMLALAHTMGSATDTQTHRHTHTQLTREVEVKAILLVALLLLRDQLPRYLGHLLVEQDGKRVSDRAGRRSLRPVLPTQLVVWCGLG